MSWTIQSNTMTLCQHHEPWDPFWRDSTWCFSVLANFEGFSVPIVPCLGWSENDPPLSGCVVFCSFLDQFIHWVVVRTVNARSLKNHLTRHGAFLGHWGAPIRSHWNFLFHQSEWEIPKDSRRFADLEIFRFINLIGRFLKFWYLDIPYLWISKDIWESQNKISAHVSNTYQSVS